MNFVLKYNLVCLLETILIPVKLVGLILWLPYMIICTIRFKWTKEIWCEIIEGGVDIAKDAISEFYLDDDEETTEYCETEESSL